MSDSLYLSDNDISCNNSYASSLGFFSYIIQMLMITENVSFNLLFMGYVNVKLDAKYRKMRWTATLDCDNSQDRKDPECFSQCKW